MMKYFDNSLSAQITGKFSKNTLARYLLFLVLVLPCFVKAEALSISLVAIFLVWLVFSQWRIKRGFFILLFPIFMLLVLGIINARQYSFFEVLKDVWYTGKIIVGVGFGYILARYLKGFRAICRSIIAAAVISSIIHFIQIAIYYRSGMTLFDLRDDEGLRGYYITAIGLALMVVFWRRRHYISMNRLSYYFSVFLCAGSLIASFSRTLIISFLVIVVVLKGWGRLNVKNLFKIATVVGMIVLVVILSAPENNTKDKSLIGKFINLASEVKVRNYDDMKGISLHWRGFDSYRALLDFQGGNTVEKIIGQGLGATADLCFYMNLGGAEIHIFQYSTMGTCMYS